MAKPPFILIICDAENLRHWEPMLAEIGNTLGPIRIITENEVFKGGLAGKIDLVVIDISGSIGLPRLVAYVREQQTECKILIVSAAPTWRKARQAFYIGATDYIPKQYTTAETISAMRSVLKMSSIKTP